MRALIAVLEHIPRPVLVTDAAGNVLHANAAGETLLAARGMSERIPTAIRGHDGDLEAHELDDAGTRYLLIGRSIDVVPGLVARAAERWSLTPRQRDVLMCVVRGYSNARTSLLLEVSERTVEVHVTAILDRAACCSRAQIIAAVLTS